MRALLEATTFVFFFSVLPLFIKRWPEQNVLSQRCVYQPGFLAGVGYRLLVTANKYGLCQIGFVLQDARLKDSHHPSEHTLESVLLACPLRNQFNWYWILSAFWEPIVTQLNRCSKTEFKPTASCPLVQMTWPTTNTTHATTRGDWPIQIPEAT